ncbi:uncharacterized protein SPSK_07621 [Sporothrix schenckii 1099-18]|uniref:Cytochrome oxidase c assembly-domain-containing protein n=1 Tax=Sporothrix schenckii 1099-18 TaxID=1397361 RepID=A0A0F2MFW1_SPOSC|nr:uncharacterized protein SPSK_07621 [Sporothrix schenckii 1099-18]KJR87750.1 hypothetical protein SPSK_07621 [Sporothrix schenckii 1099-18]
MAIPTPPRSVSDATRFTSTTPHAWSAAAAASVRRATSSQAAFASSSSSTSSSNTSRFQSPASSRPPAAAQSKAARRGATPAPGGPRGPRGPSPAGGAAAPVAGETPEQKVARLRAAHQAAKNAKVSQLDRVIGGTRRVFDNAHRFTIVGLIGFTAIAGLLTAYTTVDMLRFNSRRKKEFQAAQQQMDADSLAAARLAFMRGDATPAQAAMVEAAHEHEQAVRSSADGGAAAAADASRGEAPIFKVPSLLGAPAPVAAPVAAPEQEAAATTSTDASSWGGGIRSWFSSTPRAKEEDDASKAAGAPPKERDTGRALEEKQKAAAAAYQAITDRARQALDSERANQRDGGPLDRLGLDDKSHGTAIPGNPAATPAAKKSWWQVW